MPIDADVAGGYGSPGNRPNDPRGPGGKDPGGPEKDKDENKTTDFSGLGLTFGDDGKLVTFGQDKTPVGLTQKYFSNNPQNIQPAYDAGLMNTGVASLFSGQGLLNTKPLTNANTNINPNIMSESVNQLALDNAEEEAEDKKTFTEAFKSLGEDAFVDRLMKSLNISEDVAKLASAKMNTSPEEAYGMIKNAIGFGGDTNLLGGAYNALGASQLTPGMFAAGQFGKQLFGFGEALLGPTLEGLSDLTGIGNYKARKYFTKNPQNIGTVALEDENFNNAFADPSVPFANITPKYTGPMTAAIADEVAEIQGGFLSPSQQADLAIEAYRDLETEKNRRPGNPSAINPYVPIDPVRSKYEDEALEAYDRYIKSGYSPEEAEYLVSYMGLA